MNRTTSSLAVLFDSEALLTVHPHWPANICLAICLSDDGQISLLSFRAEEIREMPDRILEATGLNANELCVVPKVAGFPTRILRYSEQQNLLEIVKDNPSVLEEALDYAVNFQFAMEEGLDPREILDPVFNRASGQTGKGFDLKGLEASAPSLPSFMRNPSEQGINAAPTEMETFRRTVHVGAKGSSLVFGPETAQIEESTHKFSTTTELFSNATGHSFLLMEEIIGREILTMSAQAAVEVAFPSIPKTLIEHLGAESFVAAFSEANGHWRVLAEESLPKSNGILRFVSQRQRKKPDFPRWTLMAG